MTRIFGVMAIFSVGLLCLNILLGLAIGDYNGAFATFREQGEPLQQEIRRLRDQRPRPVKEIDQLRDAFDQQHEYLVPIERRALVHILAGVGAALVAVLVNSICVTYFIGTGRWVREVAETYRLDQHFVADSSRLKRGTFPWALIGTLTALGIISMGAASHPGTIREGTAAWVTPHYVGALLGTALIAMAFYVQTVRIRANYALIDQVVAEVQAVRRERGLDQDEDDEEIKNAKSQFTNDTESINA